MTNKQAQITINAIKFMFDHAQYFDDVEEALNMAISALAEQRWIPTSERLPKVREWVLCQCRAGIIDVLRLTEDGDWNKNYPHVEYMSGFVVAWMPLPKPYKAERREDG